MRPAVAMLTDIKNPTEEEEQVLRALGPHAAAPGFRFVIDADTQEIIQAPFFYLYATYGQDGKKTEHDDAPSIATNRAAAYELAEWFRFLAFVRHRWQSANHELIRLYAHLLATKISYQTGRIRESASIAHKLSTIYGFYGWTNAAELTNVKWDTASIRATFKRKGRDRRDACDDKIRPFSPKEIQTVLSALGPLPSERPKDSLRPCRNRLLFETGLLTGMREEEICYVRADAILALKVNLDEPDATQPLKIKVTKGRKRRWIALPNSLIHDLQIYIRKERREAVAKRLKQGRADEGFLFVNHADHNKAGAKITTQTIQRLTHALMLRLNFAEPAKRKRDDQTVSYMRTLHTFHDTRHSYAVNLYISQRLMGDPKPWETVQRMLGHDDWATTERYYLRAVGVIEPQIGVRLNRYWG